MKVLDDLPEELILLVVTVIAGLLFCRQYNDLSSLLEIYEVGL